MPRIKTIDPKDATGRLKEIYDELIQKRGKLAEVHKIQSLRPESITAHMDLYLEIMFSRSQLSRAQREMMAVVVSVSNGCDYCNTHHGLALKHYWKSDEQIENLRNDFESASFLSDKDKTLCRFARHLTQHPADFTNTATIESLKNMDFTDEVILDATLVVSYFNFVNRIVLALGLEISEEEVGGYKY